jgi:hypothetical protein
MDIDDSTNVMCYVILSFNSMHFMLRKMFQCGMRSQVKRVGPWSVERVKHTNTNLLYGRLCV